MWDSRKMTRPLVVASALTLSAAWHRHALRKAIPELMWLLPILVFIWLSLTYIKLRQSVHRQMQQAETRNPNASPEPRSPAVR